MLADDFALLFRIADAAQRRIELLGGVDVDDLHVHVLREGVHHLRRLVQAQEAVVDEDAGELLADGAVDERRGDRGIDAAGETEDHLVAAHLAFYFLDRFRYIVRHAPVAAAVADLAHEAPEDLRALARVRHFGVELHRIEAPRLIGHAGDRAGVGRSHELEARGQRDDLVAVAHPDFQHAVPFRRAEILDAVEQLGVAARADFCITEFAHFSCLDPAPELLRHGLHAVADAEHRDAELEHRLWGPRGRLLVRGHVTAGEDHAARAELAHESVADIAGVDLAVHACFAHAAGDELGVLGAEIEDEDFLVLTRAGHFPPPSLSVR